MSCCKTRSSVVAMPLRIRALLNAKKAEPRAKKAKPESVARKILPPKKKGGGAPRGAPPGRIETRCGACPVSFSSDAGGPRSGSSRELGPHGAGALAFRRPTAASEALKPRLGFRPRFLESPDANGRTLSGTSAASTSQSGHAPDGTLPKPPAGAVYGRTHENRPRSALRSTLAIRRPSSSGILGN